MIGEQIYPNLWVTLTQEVRDALAREFKLSKTGNTVTHLGGNGGKLESDGYTAADLLGITREKMATFVGYSTDTKSYLEMFSDCVDKAGGKEIQSIKRPVKAGNEKKHEKVQAEG